jgi:hypothetical protein
MVWYGRCHHQSNAAEEVCVLMKQRTPLGTNESLGSVHV